MVLAMTALTVFVIAMIASYAGAFAKPTLHHLTVAVAAPEKVVDAVRGRDALAINEVGDDAAAQQQVRERTADSAFVVGPGGEMTIYVAGGGGRSVATAAETVGREVAASGGFAATVRDIAPTSAADPSGTVEFYAIIFISIGASLGATAFGYIMGKVRRPTRFLLRTLTLMGYSALLAGVVTVYVDAVLGALPGHTLGRLRGAVALRDGGRGRRHGCRGRVRSARVDAADLVPGRGRQRGGRGPGRQAAVVRLLLDLLDDRPAGFGRRVAAQYLVLRRQRCPGTAGHAGDMGCGGLSARGPSHGISGELSCPV